MRLLAAIIVFCVGVAASAELITIYPDGFSPTPIGLITVYQDGLAPVSNGGGGGEPPYEVPTEDMKVWYKFETEAIVDSSPAGTNLYQIQSAPVFSTNSATMNAKYTLDGVDDKFFADVQTDMMTGAVATVKHWFLSPADTGNDENLWEYFGASAATSFRATIRYGGGQDYIQVVGIKDSVTQWVVHTGVDSFDKYVGVWNHLSVKLNGTRPLVTINNDIQTLVDADTTDLSFGFDDAQLATTKISNLNIGLSQAGGTGGFVGGMNHYNAWDNRLFSDVEDQNYYTNTRVGHGAIAFNLSNPESANMLLHFPYEYDSAYNVGNSGTNGITGGTTFTTANTNGYMSFDGVNDFTYSAGGKDLANGATNLFISTWVKPSTIGTLDAPFYYRGSADTMGLQVNSANTNIISLFWVTDGSVPADEVSMTNTLTEGEWTLVSAHYQQGSVCSIYANGVLMNTTIDSEDSTLTVDDWWYQGLDDGQGTSYWPGGLDEGMIFINVADPDALALSIFNQTTSVHPNP